MHPDSPESQYFSTGCYFKDGKVGLRAECRRFPASSAFLAKFIQHVDPDFCFSSVSIFCIVFTGLHKDAPNAPIDNLFIPITNFRNGGLWIEGPGDKTHIINGAPVSGSHYSLHPKRLVAVAYSSQNLHLLPLRDKETVKSLCFPLPPQLVSNSTCSPPPPAPSASANGTPVFLERVKCRIAKRSLPDLFCIEIFAGSAGLCRALIKCGYAQSLGVDKHVSPGARAPVLALDLTKDSDLQLFMDLLRSDKVVACHLAPPCGTSSLAREIPGGPPPLRSDLHPDGVPSLSGLDLIRVTQANLLYKVTADIFHYCCHTGILCTVENPRRSHFWRTRHMREVQNCAIWSHFHHCMMGSKRRKATTLLHNFPQACRMRLECDGSHEHEPGRSKGG